MKVIITRAFEGYPEGPDKPSQHFAPSDEPVEVPDEFGTMIVGKALARDVAKGNANHEAE